MTNLETTHGQDILLRAGTTSHDQFAVDIDPQRAGWTYSGLRVVQLAAGASQSINTGDSELLILPLAGAVTVNIDDTTYEIAGRDCVFTSITDYLYIGRRTSFTMTSEQGGRFALPSAIAERDLPTIHYGRDQVRTDLRGAGDCSRQVNNYALANGVETSHLLCCEVLTPNGNWSSYPPHKHDETNDVERELEEIYYFEIADSSTDSNPAGPHHGFALHRTYGTPERPIELSAEIHSGDAVVIPHGYHGPTVAAPGYDLYYLNVMAGPGTDGVWMSTDDPHHAWIRESWEGQEIDPRLPMTR